MWAPERSGVALHGGFGLPRGLVPLAEQVARLREHEAAVGVVRVDREHGFCELCRLRVVTLRIQRAAVAFALEQVGARHHRGDLERARELLRALVEQVDRVGVAAAHAEAAAGADDPLGVVGLLLDELQERLRGFGELAAVLGAVGLLAQAGLGLLLLGLLLLSLGRLLLPLGLLRGRERRRAGGQQGQDTEGCEADTDGCHVSLSATSVPQRRDVGGRRGAARPGGGSDWPGPRPWPPGRPCCA